MLLIIASIVGSVACHASIACNWPLMRFARCPLSRAEISFERILRQF
jgi:hypothetical protein